MAFTTEGLCTREWLQRKRRLMKIQLCHGGELLVPSSRKSPAAVPIQNRFPVAAGASAAYTDCLKKNIDSIHLKSSNVQSLQTLTWLDANVLFPFSECASPCTHQNLHQFVVTKSSISCRLTRNSTKCPSWTGAYHVSYLCTHPTARQKNIWTFEVLQGKYQSVRVTN